jgi:hypothetical protein
MQPKNVDEPAKINRPFDDARLLLLKHPRELPRPIRGPRLGEGDGDEAGRNPSGAELYLLAAPRHCCLRAQPIGGVSLRVAAKNCGRKGRSIGLEVTSNGDSIPQYSSVLRPPLFRNFITSMRSFASAFIAIPILSIAQEFISPCFFYLSLSLSLSLSLLFIYCLFVSLVDLYIFKS